MFDVEVLGAGPAGAYVANALARRGFSVRLVDRATFPREKLCGGGLTRKGMDLIRHLEPSFDGSGLAEPVEELYLIASDGRSTTPERIPPGLLSLVRRREFDAWWRERALDAGAEGSSRALGLEGARFVVAADGAGSAYGKAIRGPFRNDQVAVATECVSGSERKPFAAIVVSPAGSGTGWGYSWLFGRSDGIVTGTGFRRDQIADLGALRRRIVDVSRRFTRAACSGFSNWVIPLYRPRPAARGRVALVGDALGTADPLFAEGIAFGMASSQALVESWERDGNFDGYPEQLRRHPFFRAMPYYAFLQQLGGGDPDLTYRSLRATRVFQGLRRTLEDPSAARHLVQQVAVRHPVTASRIWWSVRGQWSGGTNAARDNPTERIASLRLGQ